jgi:branched-chain amino acid transport system permease protein
VARRTRDLRAHLTANYPRLSARLPEEVIKPANVVWAGWQRIGYGRYLVAAALMALVPLAMDNGYFPVLTGNYGKDVLVRTGIWILLALGLNVVVGLAGLLDLGYVAFFMLGAYTTAFMTHSGAPGQFHFAQWSIWAALPFALLVAMLAGVAIGLPTLRLRGDYLAIVTLGFHEVVLLTMNNISITNGPRGIFGIETPSIHLLGINLEFGLTSQYYWWYLLIPAVLLAVIMLRHLENSRVGRYWTAIREDEVAAGAMGVPVTRMKVLAFVIGASTSGVAGWIYAGYTGFISPDSFPLLQSILVLSAVVIGGMGSIAGSVLGGILIIALPEVIRTLAGGHTIFGFDPDTGRAAIFGLLIVVVMIFRSGGLLAPRRRRTELHETGEGDEGADSQMTRETAAEEDLSKTRPESGAGP